MVTLTVPLESRPSISLKVLINQFTNGRPAFTRIMALKKVPKSFVAEFNSNLLLFFVALDLNIFP